MAMLQAFQSPEHQPFLWQQGPVAVLMVHGFPGTPAEMRPAAEALARRGWTAQGLLLPGFGPEIAAMEQHDLADWLDAIRQAARELRRQHARVVLLGNSTGGALCLQVAAASRLADAVILVAPYWQSSSRLFDSAFPLLSLFWRRIYPFRKADFSSPALRSSMRKVLPDADLDDPDVQHEVRELSMSTQTLGAVRAAGRLGYAAAPAVVQPTLVLQGADDPVAVPRLSQRLAQRLPALYGYVHLRADHDLILMAGSQPIDEILHRFLVAATNTSPSAVDHG